MNSVTELVQKQGLLFPNRVFVGGINENSTDSELRQFFSTFGNVIDCKIVFDRTGVSKGYGFVTFERQEDAQALIRKDKKEGTRIVFKDKRLNIGEAVKRLNTQNSCSSKYDAANCGNLPESAGTLGLHGNMTTPSSIHYIDGYPYVYVNPPHAPIGIPSSPQMLPVAPAYPQMIVVPPMNGFCPLPASHVPVGMIPPVYGGPVNTVNNGSVEGSPYPTAMPQNPEVLHVGSGESVYYPFPLTKIDGENSMYGGSSTMRRVGSPPAGHVAQYELVFVTPLYRLGHPAI